MNAAIRAYLQAIGSKGGKKTGPTKSRGTEHYKRIARISAGVRRAKAAAKKGRPMRKARAV